MALAAAAWAAAADVTKSPDTHAVLQQAQEAAAHGNPDRGVSIIEDELARLGPPGGKLGIVIPLHLWGADFASQADEAPRARDHLAAIDHLLPSFSTTPRARASLLNREAEICEHLGDLARAEPLLAAAVDAVAAIDPLAAAVSANELGKIRLDTLRAADAEAAFYHSMELLRRGGASPERLFDGLISLIMAQLQAGELHNARITYAQAEAAARNKPQLGPRLNLIQAQLLTEEGDLKQADDVLGKLVARGGNSRDLIRAHALYLLATSRFNLGLMPEAAEAGLEAAGMYQAMLGEWSPALGRAFHLLGTAYLELGQAGRGADFFEAAARVEQRTFGQQSVQYQATKVEQGWAELQRGNVAAAGRWAREALDVMGNAQPRNPRPEGLAHVLLALAADAENRRTEAVENYAEGQRLIELANGAHSPDLTFSLVKLGRLFTRMGRYADADEKLTRAIGLLQEQGARGTVRLAEALEARADLRREEADRTAEMNDSRRAFTLLKGTLATEAVSAETAFGESFQNSAREMFGVHALRVVGSGQTKPTIADEEEAFAASQYALTSRTGESLRRATVRMSIGDNQLVQLLREREDGADEVRRADFALARTLSEGGNQNQDFRKVATAKQRAEQAAQKSRALDSILTQRFPSYRTFIQPEPVSLAAVRKVLASDEILLMTVVTDTKMLVWSISRDSVDAAEEPVSARMVADMVNGIRSNIQQALERRDQDVAPDFDVEAARKLYDVVVAPAGALLNGKSRIIFLPDGALESIPLHILVRGDGPDWLIRSYAVSTEPSLSAFTEAREHRRPSSAARAFLGIGVSDFSGFDETADDELEMGDRGRRDVLARLQKLPDAVAELKTMAAMFPPADEAVVFDATKSTFLRSAPMNYRTIAFSTHAVMAGGALGLTEPAIVMFPDGKSVKSSLLTASDIAALTLDADLVILSACDTAAPDGGPYPEALSGLARSFMHAGSRSMLVSHWSVPIESAAAITTQFLVGVEKDPDHRKAEALRSAMLKLLTSGDRNLSHPAYWAPFVVVGE